MRRQKEKSKWRRNGKEKRERREKRFVRGVSCRNSQRVICSQHCSRSLRWLTCSSGRWSVITSDLHRGQEDSQPAWITGIIQEGLTWFPKEFIHIVVIDPFSKDVKAACSPFCCVKAGKTNQKLLGHFQLETVKEKKGKKKFPLTRRSCRSEG